MSRPIVALCMECWKRNPAPGSVCEYGGKHRTRSIYADSMRFDEETASYEADSVSGTNEGETR